MTSRAAGVMSEREFLNRRGVGAPIGFATVDTVRLPHGETQRQRSARIKATQAQSIEYARQREAAREEYRQLVDSGAVRAPTRIERALETARGHPDNEATQAARRLLKKRGYDWRTGNRL